MRKVSSARGKVAKAADARTPPKRASVKNNSLAENDADSSDVDEQPLSSLLHPRNEDNENRLSGDAVPGALSDSTEAESFEVESILSSRVRHGKQQFKIRWKGYGPADDTWEDEECIDSPDLIAAYLKGPPDETKAGKTKSPKPKAKGVKRNASASSEKTAVKKAKGNGDGTEEYEVTKIVDDVLLKDGTRQFLVRWKGFTSKENTWEPEANLNCPELIQKYLELQENREGTDRETRTERKQVYKYNPELTKRRSHRSTKSEVDDTSTYHYQQRGDSPYSILDSRSRSSSWNSSQGSYNISDSLCMEKSNSWYSNVSSKCSIM